MILFPFSFTFHEFPKTERKKFLKTYKFDCDCEACVKNFPTVERLPIYDITFVDRRFYELPAEELIKEFKANCEFTAKNMHLFPCVELAQTDVRNHNLLHKLGQYASLIGNNHF